MCPHFEHYSPVKNDWYVPQCTLITSSMHQSIGKRWHSLIVEGFTVTFSCLNLSQLVYRWWRVILFEIILSLFFLWCILLVNCQLRIMIQSKIDTKTRSEEKQGPDHLLLQYGGLCLLNLIYNCLKCRRHVYWFDCIKSQWNWCFGGLWNEKCHMP